MIEYPGPIKPIQQTAKMEIIDAKKEYNATKDFIDKITNPLKSFFNWLYNPKPKKDELQEAYKKRYNEIYRKEREEYLIKKAEEDAKKKARKDTGFISFIMEIITGGRNR